MIHDKRHHYLDTVDQVLSQAVDRGILHLDCDDQPHEGPWIAIDGRRLVNFGSCSYLGLERDPRLIEGVIAAVRRFGTQFSSSRAYLSIGLYAQLEARLAEIFGSPVVVTPSTSLGHQAALPGLVDDDDAVILDHHVHASVRSAAQSLKVRGVPVRLVRHSDIGDLEALFHQLRPDHRRVWYLADGVYSMYGDFAPLAALGGLLDHEQFHLYLDDAHGMSWTGANGRGFVREHLRPHPRVMLAVSLNKAFAAAGGALVFPSQEWARRVRTCGPTLVFSGPVQPPMLGAALASAEIHRSGQIHALQARLRENLARTREALVAHHLPLIGRDPTPIFFIATGLPRVAYNLVRRLFDDGFYLNIGTFPATPMQAGGVRFTVTVNHSPAEIERLAARLADHYLDALADEGVTTADVERAFAGECDLSGLTRARGRGRAGARARAPLELSAADRIDAIDGDEWGQLMAGRGCLDAGYLALLERVFRGHERPEDNWRFRYLVVRDPSGAPVVATVLTAILAKDDLFAPETVSTAIERQREADPYLLTSTLIMAGTAAGEGNPIFVRSEHPRWQEALSLVCDELRRWGDAVDASMVLLRDFDGDDDRLLAAPLLDRGFARVALPNRHVIADLGWASEAEYLARLGSRYRYSLRREALAYRDRFDVFVDKPADPALRAACYRLYLEVQARGRVLSTFPLPAALVDAFFDDPGCDVLRIHLRGDDAPAAVMFSHYRPGGVYSAGFVGLDYRLLETHKVYKQILYRTVERAAALGCRRLELGFTAGLEKRKVGAVAVPSFGYALIRDSFNLDIIESMVVAPPRELARPPAHRRSLAADDPGRTDRA